MADTLGDLTSALQNFIVAPLNAFGMGGYVFDVQDEGTAVLAADITDHYTEDNKAVQDHIAIRPKRITLKGFVGELVYSAPHATDNTTLQEVTQRLTEIDAFLPQLSAATVQEQTAISAISSNGLTSSNFTSALAPTANIYSLVQNVIGQFGITARQQNAYQFFSACQYSGMLMGIQTPWEFLANMVVETVVAIQGGDTIFETDFAVTFKQIRVAQTITGIALSGTGGLPTPAGVLGQTINAQQIAPITNLGATPGAVGPIISPSGITLDVFEYP